MEVYPPRRPGGKRALVPKFLDFIENIFLERKPEYVIFNFAEIRLFRIFLTVLPLTTISPGLAYSL